MFYKIFSDAYNKNAVKKGNYQSL